MPSTATNMNPEVVQVFLNHIYEFSKGVRQMVLFTADKKYAEFTTNRLRIQPVGDDKINLFFGRKECINAIRLMVTRPLNKLTPEEDFIIGAMLGYDICGQCRRYCERKCK